MAGIPFNLSVTGIALTAATAKTVAQLIAATNTRAKINTITVEVYAGAAGSAPGLVEIMRNSSITGTSYTLLKRDESAAETLQTTAKHTATVEPTGTNVALDTQKCNVTSGRAMFTYQDLYVKGGSFAGVRVTSPVTATCDVQIEGEE